METDGYRLSYIIQSFQSPLSVAKRKQPDVAESLNAGRSSRRGRVGGARPYKVITCRISGVQHNTTRPTSARERG